MTQILSLRNLIAASGFATVAAIAMTSLATEASASVNNCRGKSPNDVLKCCQEEVAEHGRPDWMRANKVNCSTASVACRSSAGGNYRPVAAVAVSTYNKCKIIVLKPNDRYDGGKSPNRDPNGRDPAGSPTHGSQDANNPKAF